MDWSDFDYRDVRSICVTIDKSFIPEVFDIANIAYIEMLMLVTSTRKYFLQDICRKFDKGNTTFDY